MHLVYYAMYEGGFGTGMYLHFLTDMTGSEEEGHLCHLKLTVSIPPHARTFHIH